MHRKVRHMACRKFISYCNGMSKNYDINFVIVAYGIRIKFSLYFEPTYTLLDSQFLACCNAFIINRFVINVENDSFMHRRCAFDIRFGQFFLFLPLS